MDKKGVMDKLEVWEIPSWWASLNEFEMNSYLAGKLDMEPRKVGPGDVRSDEVWIECKRDLLDRGTYASLCDELERHPKGISSIAVIFGDGREDLVAGLTQKFPEVSIIIKGGGRRSFPKDKLAKEVDFRGIGEAFKSYAVEHGIPELVTRNPRANQFILDLPVLPGVSWGFGIMACSVRLGLGTNRIKGTLRSSFRQWEGKLGNIQGRNEPTWYSFEWEREVDGHRSNREDWSKFVEALVELYFEAKEESKEFLGILKEKE